MMSFKIFGFIKHSAQEGKRMRENDSPSYKNGLENICEVKCECLGIHIYIISWDRVNNIKFE